MSNAAVLPIGERFSDFATAGSVVKQCSAVRVKSVSQRVVPDLKNVTVPDVRNIDLVGSFRIEVGKIQLKHFLSGQLISYAFC